MLSSPHVSQLSVGSERLEIETQTRLTARQDDRAAGRRESAVLGRFKAFFFISFYYFFNCLYALHLFPSLSQQSKPLECSAVKAQKRGF